MRAEDPTETTLMTPLTSLKDGPLIAGIDAGGTAFKLGVARAGGGILRRRSVPTTTPDETLAATVAAFRELEAELGAPIAALGIASFGPVDIDPASSAYGTILETPKPGWAGTPLRARLAEALGVPTRLETDVNGALIAEMTAGAARDVQSAAYITIGTGIGAGIRANGGLLGQPAHPEFGHVPVHRHVDDENFAGSCPFHGDCLEGLASGSALAARGLDPAALPKTHPVWEVLADYLAQACLILTLTLRLDRIVLGGGVMKASPLLGRIHEAYQRRMGGYVAPPPGGVEGLIVRAGLGDEAGLRGALLLGEKISAL